MYSLNRATLIGNLTRDPEVRQTPSGQSVCSFGLATNRSWTDNTGKRQEQVEFHSLVAWGKLAEICGQYLVKGRKVYVEGRLQTREWEGQDGAKRTRTEIVIENMIILDRAGASGTSSGSASPFTPPQAPASEPTAAPEEEIKIEDIPF
jgi:single-strand DNA-binding protein